MLVGDSNSTPVASLAPKSTVEVLVKPVPVIATDVPPVCGPSSGSSAVTDGTGSYVKRSAGPVAVMPPGVVTVTSTVPAAAAAGEVAVICVGDSTCTAVASVEPKLTVELFVKWVPVILTSVPPVSGPSAGWMLATVGPGGANTHAATPTPPLAARPPISAVFPSLDSATLRPKALGPLSSPPVSLGPSCDHTPPERANIHAAPRLSSSGAPTRATLPSDDSATLVPKVPSPPSSPPPVSLSPCWVQVEPERANTHAAPMPPSSRAPPTRAVPASADSATLVPNSPLPASPSPCSSACCVHVAPERVNTHAAPAWVEFSSPPIRAVLPSPDSATLRPNSPLPISPSPVSLVPCWVQLEPEPVNTQAAPAWLLSEKPPIRAVLPSPESATRSPNDPAPISPLPVSFARRVQVEPERVYTQASPADSLLPGSPIRAVLPSPESATPRPK